MRDINWNLYRSFIAVYETRNLHDASRSLEISRSAVGQNIKALSSQIGANLFNSHAKGVEPTCEAIELYPTIKNAVDLILEAEESLQTFTEESKAVIKMAIPTSFLTYTLRDYIKGFCKKYPNVEFEFFKRGSFELLEHCKVDFIIDFDHFFEQYNFKQINICSDRNVIIVSPRLLDSRGFGTTITKDEFLQLPIIGQKEFINMIANKTGLGIKPYIATATTEIVFDMISNGIGAGIHLSKVVSKLDNQRIIKLNVQGLSLPVANYVCAYKGRLTKASRAFIKGLLEFCKKDTVEN